MSAPVAPARRERMSRGNGEVTMIKLTHLDGEAFILNAELIRYVEARPDTYVTLTSGDRLIVQEPMDEVMRRAVDYQRAKFLIPSPRPVSSPSTLCPADHEPGRV
jgi:flagellar protein FlbD